VPDLRVTRNRFRKQLLLSLTIGLIVGVLASYFARLSYGPSLGWIAAALAFLLMVWRDVWRLDGQQTRALAAGEDASSTLHDVILICAAVISLVTVVLVLSHQGSSSMLERGVRTAIGIVSVVLAWAVVHTVYTLRYAKLYYVEPEGGIDFHMDEPPAYSDFAYVAFGVGMAFQVADTDLRTRKFRIVVLRHALLSFLFATTILAVAINLVAGLNS
jgi:uncharacterized membrane protein